MADESLSIEMFPAEHGDAFLLVGRTSTGHLTHILIDGGTEQTFESHLRHRLSDIRSSGGRLDLVIVTHVDADHIGGVIRLLEENGHNSTTKIVDIGEVWHNSYRHLGMEGRLPTAEELTRVSRGQVRHSGRGVGQISGKQGTMLAGLLRRGGYAWNSTFGNGPIVADPTRRVRIGSLDMRILTPTHAALQSLAYRWRNELVQLGVAHNLVSSEFEEHYEAVLMQETSMDVENSTPISFSSTMDVPDATSFVEDKSRSNRSSISFILSLQDISCLFLADALPGDVELSLRTSGLTLPAQFEAVKVSHHGSRHNTSPSLLHQIASQRYLVSTDGSRHGHPDLECLLWIADNGPTEFIFNCPTAISDRFADERLRMRLGHRATVGDGERPIRIELQNCYHGCHRVQ